MSVESMIEERQAAMGHMKPLYQQEVIEVDVASLKHHPLNEALYGTHIDPEFVENIRQHGVQEPITICRSTEEAIDGVVVKGRRRCRAAEALGIDRIRAVEWYCDSEDEFRKQLILSNVRNEQPLDHRVRMYTELKEIEARAAVVRQQKGSKVGGSTGKSSDLAAKKVGLSRSTAMRGEKVLAAAKALEESGKSQEAQELVETLNTQGATIAAKAAAVAVPSLDLQPVVPSVLENLRGVDRSISALKNTIKAAYAAYGAVIRCADAVQADEPKLFKAGHKQLEDKCRMIEKHLSAASDAAEVMGEQWGVSKKGIVNGKSNAAAAKQLGSPVGAGDAAAEGTEPSEDGPPAFGDDDGVELTDAEVREDIKEAIGFDPGESRPF